MERQFTWVPTYRAITKWLHEKESEQKYLIAILKKIGIEGFKDINKDMDEFELDEIDPFSFFAYLNKYKLDSKKIALLQRIHSELQLTCEKPLDVVGIPSSHPLKVRLFPFKYLRTNDEISTLWRLFRQVVDKNIDDSLFRDALRIRGVGKTKLSICFFYVDPEYYLSLDSKSIHYLKKRKLKYSFVSITTYLKLSADAQETLKLTPYEISHNAWDAGDSAQIDDDSKIGSVRTLLSVLDKLNVDSYKEEVVVYYRGHSSVKYKLEPSIFRNNNIAREDKLFKDIITRCPADFIDCNSTFEKLVKMQHYSLPTRLLDITSNPLVALYFACKNYKEEEDDEDGRLYRFEIKENDVKYFDSDSVSVVANISRRPETFSIEKIKNKSKADFNDEDAIQYLLHEIRSEKPHFLSLIEAKHIESIFCVKPRLNNPRIIRQEGAFFIVGINNDKKTPAKLKNEDIEFTSYIINKIDKGKILKQLDALGINESVLFPEIEHVAKHLKEKF